MASVYDAVDYITSSFKEPLDKQGVGSLTLWDEIEAVICYSYFALLKENYKRFDLNCTQLPMQKSGQMCYYFVNWYLAYLFPMVLLKESFQT